MSTRSRIGMLNDDGTVTSIYCHSDGYPEDPHGVGYKLSAFWSESVRPLLALGDLSVLGEVLGKDEGHGAFDRCRTLIGTDDERRAWCVAYNRDRGETDTEASTHPAGEWPDSGQEYEYLWTGREWKMRRPGQDWVVLSYTAPRGATQGRA